MSTSRCTDRSEHDPGEELTVLDERRIEAPAQGPVVTVAVAQLGGRWLDPAARLQRAAEAAALAAASGSELLVFPETYLAGYPYWLSRTDGARFNQPRQKAAYAYYLQRAVEVGGPETTALAEIASGYGLTLMVGVTERGTGTYSGSTFASLVTVHPTSGVVNVHRKLMPTYDERIVWARGDGAGLRAQRVGAATVGGLNCWENWMPQARFALYAGGEEVHVGVWPGSSALTTDITRFIALEGRVFSIAAGGLLRREDVPEDFPLVEELSEDLDAMPFDGGSAVAAPDGTWLIPPVIGREGLLIAELDLSLVHGERLMFDPAGHYSRPDVFDTRVDRTRQSPIAFTGTP